MTKQELAQKVAQDADLGSGDARKAVDAVFDAIASELSNGGEVAVSGFCKFSVSRRAAQSSIVLRDGRTLRRGRKCGLQLAAQMSVAASRRSRRLAGNT